jgi:HSP20 family protein
MIIWPFRSAWDALDELQREMERIFDLTLVSSRFFWEAGRQYPPINVYETANEFILIVPLPGVKPQDLEVTTVGDRLTIRGERKRQQLAPEETFRREERWMGSWCRTIGLPERADPSSVTGTLENGLLVLRVAKVPEAQSRQVQIRTA